MARDESPPFELGKTWFNGGTVDSTSGAQFEGKEYVFEDIDISTGQLRSGKRKRVRVVRNVATVALLPKRLVKFKTTGATTFGSQVDGYATGNTVATSGDFAFPVDEFLPTAGVPVNDLFYIVVEGPAMCITTLDDSQAGIDIAVGGRVGVAKTAAGTTGTTAGRIEAVTVSNHTDQTAATLLQSINALFNSVGRAMSANVTNTTNSSVLIEVCRW